MTNLSLATQPRLSPAVEELLESVGDARTAPLDARERRVEGAIATVFLLAAVVLAVTAGDARAPGLPTALLLVGAYAVAMRVRFAVGAGYAVPVQLVFVPMLLLVPPAWTPLLVLGGIVLSHLPDYVRGRCHRDRVVLWPGDALHALAPAAVLVVAGSGGPDLSDWPIYLVALATQVGGDYAITALREYLALGIAPALQRDLHGWIAGVDALLAPIGLLAALAAADTPAAVLLVLPLAALLAVFAGERRQRIDHALELGRAYRGTTLLLSDVIEGDDEYTGMHSRDVVSLSMAVAARMGLDDRRRQLVEFGALLHDVGKIAVPNEIINKPGKLTDDEWTIIKAHTIEGQRMLDRVGGVMGEVGRVVRSSHERWDGGGYPDGLAGEAIPLESAIVSCCDAFNAMTTTRSYRKAMPLEDAVQELRANSGSQFHPDVVAVLLEVVGEGTPAAVPAPSQSAVA